MGAASGTPDLQGFYDVIWLCTQEPALEPWGIAPQRALELRFLSKGSEGFPEACHPVFLGPHTQQATWLPFLLLGLASLGVG